MHSTCAGLDQTLCIPAGRLAVGLICNLLVRPLDYKCFMPDEEWDADRRLAHEKAVESDETVGPDGRGDSASGSELTLTCSVYRRITDCP